MIKAVIFDFAGVIGTEAFTVWTTKKDPNRQRDKQFYADLADEVDEGIISEEQFVKQVSKKLNLPKGDIHPGVRSEMRVNPEMRSLIERLKKNYKIGLISNYLHTWLEPVIEENDLAKHFDEIIISSRVKIRKPDPRIFQMMLERLKLKADETIFIDDRDYQVEGARAVGMHGIQFTGVEKLKGDLKTLGVVTD